MTLTRGRVTVLTGIDNGVYPDGNSLVVRGDHESVLIDPSLSVVAWQGIDRVDRIVLSHVHEDHVAGVSCHPDVPVHAPEGDRAAMTSLDALVSSYGLSPEAAITFGHELTDKYHFRPRPDTIGYPDGAVFDAGGSTIEAIATPGHTPGHCCLLIEPESILYLGDIDLSGFGPYYADLHSSLEDFEASIERCRAIEARWYTTFHHKGTYTDRAAFLAALDRFAAAIPRRDALLLDHLSRPRTLEALVKMRILYRPGVQLTWVDAAERHTITRHLARLEERGLVAFDGARWHQN